MDSVSFLYRWIQVPVADSSYGDVHEVGGCNELLLGWKEIEHLFSLKEKTKDTKYHQECAFLPRMANQHRCWMVAWETKVGSMVSSELRKMTFPSSLADPA